MMICNECQETFKDAYDLGFSDMVPMCPFCNSEDIEESVSDG